MQELREKRGKGETEEPGSWQVGPHGFMLIPRSKALIIFFPRSFGGDTPGEEVALEGEEYLLSLR